MIITEIYSVINKIISTFKTQRHSNDFFGIMTSGLALLEYLPELISYSVDQESEYRKLEARLTNEATDGKKNTSSYCETQAKASDFYKEWQKAKQFIELMYEMVNMAKKLSSSVDREFNTSG